MPDGRPVTISIVMPNLNGEKYLARSIASFLAQDHEQKELVIVDGRSTDGSHELIRQASATSPQIRWITQNDRGISDAINIGLEAATGDIVGYLGSDDLLDRNLLSRIADLAGLVQFDAIYFNSYTWYIEDRRIVLRRCPPLEITRRNLVEYGTIVGLQNIYFRRHVYDRHRFNVDNRYSMDYEFYLEISGEPYLYMYVDAVASINVFDGNITDELGESKQLREAIEVARRYRQHGERLFSDNPSLLGQIVSHLRALAVRVSSKGNV